MGMILEDVDGFAGDIARRHASDDLSRNVTASVDKITWLQSPPEGKSLVCRIAMKPLQNLPLCIGGHCSL